MMYNVYYDGHCGFCVRCVMWLQNQVQLIDLNFLPVLLLDTLTLADDKIPLRRNELTVVTDMGEVYYGDKALLMCLYALRDYRDWSYRLTHPLLASLVRNLYHYVAQHRYGMSKLLRLPSAERIVNELQQHYPIVCIEAAVDETRAPR